MKYGKFETADEIELAVSAWFNPRANCSVPNVWWGMDLNHECDLFIVTRAGYAYEVEIKVSKSDLVRDGRKRHAHSDYYGIIRELYFAIPKKLEPYVNLIPERAGIIIVSDKGSPHCLRKATPNLHARKLTDKERHKVAELGTLRIWRLKRQLLDLKTRRYGENSRHKRKQPGGTAQHSEL